MQKDEKPLKIALAGLGTVGASLYYLIESGQYKTASLPKGLSFERPLEICAVYASDRTKPRSVILDAETVHLDTQTIPYVTSWMDLLSCQPDVVVEATGNVGFSKELAEKTLAAGIDFVTANKALMAKHGVELQKLAEENNSVLRMEASVGGGIPILHGLYQSRGRKIKSIDGILNGTTNFILDRMTNNALSYQDALQEAQDLGFAEKPDPSFDVEGYDARSKLVLLTAIALGKFIPENFIQAKGITTVTPQDIEQARKHGYVLKLVCRAENDDTPRLHVAPYLVPAQSEFAKPKGSENIIRIRFEDGSYQDYKGLGAGGIATAEAILLDLAQLTNEEKKKNFFPFARAASEIICTANDCSVDCPAPSVKIANHVGLNYPVFE